MEKSHALTFVIYLLQLANWYLIERIKPKWSQKDIKLRLEIN